MGSFTFETEWRRLAREYYQLPQKGTKRINENRHYQADLALPG
jgi:hypothetical protein